MAVYIAGLRNLDVKIWVLRGRKRQYVSTIYRMLIVQNDEKYNF